MFRDNRERLQEIAKRMLNDRSLEEILEANDLTREEALAILIEDGVIEVPHAYEGML